MDLLDFPQNCLDVLAQFLIGLVIINERDIDEAFSCNQHMVIQKPSI